MYIQSILEFSIREMWIDNQSQWPDTRKEKVLIKQDILKPLSVDKFIWFDVFSQISIERVWDNVERDIKYKGSEWDNMFSQARKLYEPNFYRPRDSWINLIQLKEYVNHIWRGLWNPCYIIAISDVFSKDTELEITETEEEYKIVPKEVNSQWELLGYDVADYYLYTGLSEGVLDDREMKEIRSEWSIHLNKHHLFNDAQKAFDYIPIANRRNPSHMPYYVYAIHGIELILPEKPI